jgi:hypothetical protein
LGRQEERREYWFSPPLGVNLISKLQDPRIGIQNFEVSDITLGGPDAKQFELPGKSKVINLRNSRDLHRRDRRRPIDQRNGCQRKSFAQVIRF